MSIPHLEIKQTKNMIVIDVTCNSVPRGPWSILKHAITEGMEGSFIHLVDFVDIFFADMAVEMDNKGFDGIWNEIWIVSVGFGGRWWCVSMVVIVVVTGRHCCRKLRKWWREEVRVCVVFTLKIVEK